MTDIYALAALWLGLALAATMLSIWLRIATAMSEIVVGTVAQLAIGAAVGGAVLGTDQSWIKFLASTGAILLTFLAGAELDPAVLRTQWKETLTIGLVAFLAPFLGCAAAAYYLLHWSVDASWLCGIALSTTSVAVVYAVMLEFGLNRTTYGKTVLAACFINDLATVLALGLMFSPFTYRTLIFVGASVAAFVVLPWVTPRFFRRYGGRPSELEAKFLLLCLFGTGRTRGVGRQRSGAAGVCDGHGARRDRRQGPCAGAPLAHADVRSADAVLFHPRRVVRVGAGADRCAAGVPAVAGSEDADQIHRRLSADAPVRVVASGRPVYDDADVDRTHVRQHFRLVRPDARHRQRCAILVSDRRCHRQRGGADVDRQCVLPAAASDRLAGPCRVADRRERIRDHAVTKVARQADR